MKTLVFIVLLALTGVADADVLRCKGKVVWSAGDEPSSVQYRIDIIFPIQKDRNFQRAEGRLRLTLTDGNGQFNAIVGGRDVQKGMIEHPFAGLRGRVRAVFVVTQHPSQGDYLKGFFFDDIYIYTFRVDLRAENRPFFLYDSYVNEMIAGTCE